LRFKNNIFTNGIDATIPPKNEKLLLTVFVRSREESPELLKLFVALLVVVITGPATIPIFIFAQQYLKQIKKIKPKLSGAFS
jgi:hypothetical protein